jgi:hypothetical protein
MFPPVQIKMCFALLIWLLLYFLTIYIVSDFLKHAVSWNLQFQENHLVKSVQVIVLIAFCTSIVISVVNNIYIGLHKSELFYFLTTINLLGLFSRLFGFLDVLPLLSNFRGRKFEVIYYIEWFYSNVLFVYLIGMLSKTRLDRIVLGTFQMGSCIIFGFLALLRYNQEILN